VVTGSLAALALTAIRAAGSARRGASTNSWLGRDTRAPLGFGEMRLPLDFLPNYLASVCGSAQTT